MTCPYLEKKKGKKRKKYSAFRADEPYALNSSPLSQWGIKGGGKAEERQKSMEEGEENLSPVMHSSR